MGRTATIIAVSYTVVCGAAILFMALVAVSTRGRRSLDSDRLERLGEREKTWFVIVVALLVGLLFATIFFTPYGRTANAHAQVVRVKALQFAWLVPPQPLHVGRQVEFVLTSSDVTHDFAVYTSRGEFVFQIQVVPGKTQTILHTFRTPGTYKILCLEYCGVGHADMQGQFTVAA